MLSFAGPLATRALAGTSSAIVWTMVGDVIAACIMAVNLLCAGPELCGTFVLTVIVFDETRGSVILSKTKEKKKSICIEQVL